MRNNWKQKYNDLLGMFESQKKYMRQLKDKIEILKFENIALQDAKMDGMIKAREKPSNCVLCHNHRPNCFSGICPNCSK